MMLRVLRFGCACFILLTALAANPTARADTGAAIATSIIPNVNLWPASNGVDLTATLSLITNGGGSPSTQAGSCTIGGSGVGGYVANVTMAQQGFLITDLQAVAQIFKAVPDSADPATRRLNRGASAERMASAYCDGRYVPLVNVTSAVTTK